MKLDNVFNYLLEIDRFMTVNKLAVLCAIYNNPDCYNAHYQITTALPRSTISRLMHELLKMGWIERTVVDGVDKRAKISRLTQLGKTIVNGLNQNLNDAQVKRHSKVIERTKAWLEHEVINTDLSKEILCEEEQLHDFIHFGRRECAEMLLKQINKWEKEDE
jgi:DNA-binding MarR family transcriptional regulator